MVCVGGRSRWNVRRRNGADRFLVPHARPSHPRWHRRSFIRFAPIRPRNPKRYTEKKKRGRSFDRLAASRLRFRVPHKRSRHRRLDAAPQALPSSLRPLPVRNPVKPGKCPITARSSADDLLSANRRPFAPSFDFSIVSNTESLALCSKSESLHNGATCGECRREGRPFVGQQPTWYVVLVTKLSSVDAAIAKLASNQNQCVANDRQRSFGRHSN